MTGAEFGMRSAEGQKRGANDRGVALLIALLVTTLLMALVVEFAYATRISLRAAVNFRDSQRAYFLARSGVNFAGKILAENLKNGKPRANLEQREWQPVPIISTGDTELLIRWEDENGKINIANLGDGQPVLDRLESLFGLPTKRIDLDVLDRMKEKRTFRLLDELHQVMSDEEFGKVHDFVTVYAGSNNINLNTASSDVLQSMGLSEAQASLIIEGRSRGPYSLSSDIPGYVSIPIPQDARKNPKNYMVVDSSTFFVQSYATVGGYTKQAEAVITRSPGGFTIQYWKIL